MGHWEEDNFIYSPGDLKRIAYNYKDYTCPQMPCPSIDNCKDRLARDILSLKIDFDRALNHLGRGDWRGTNPEDIVTEFPFYRYYGRYQQVIIADVIGIDDSELHDFTDLSRIKGRAYRKMCDYLNGFG